MGLVHEIAGRVWRRTGRRAEYEDLVSMGKIGLMQSLEQYDAGRNLAFSTYASRRIEGAMLDELRREMGGSRVARRRIRSVRAVEATLSEKLGRAAQHEEVARTLGLDSECLWRWRDSHARVEMSLDVPMFAGRGGAAATLAETLVDASATEFEDDVAQESEIARVVAELERLPERERMVLVLYFVKELKLREIGELLGVTESRVSQMRSAALARLRERLAPLRCA